MGLDEDLFRALNGAGNPVLDPIMVGLGVAGLVFVMALWSLPLWFSRRRREAVDLLLLLGLDGVLVIVLKALFQVPRPVIGVLLEVPLDDVSDFSFPSGHASRAFAVALLLTLRTRDLRWGLPLFAYAATVGLSRVYVGVHWPSDVLAGALLGLLWAYGFERFTRTAAYARWRDGLIARLPRAHRSEAPTPEPRGRTESPRSCPRSPA